MLVGRSFKLSDSFQVGAENCLAEIRDAVQLARDAAFDDFAIEPEQFASCKSLSRALGVTPLAPLRVGSTSLAPLFAATRRGADVGRGWLQI